MTGIVWDETGKHFFETGVDHGVLYTVDEKGEYKDGVAWNGLVTITESPSGAEATAQYADNTKYLNMYSAEELGVTIEAFTYPDEFAECDGTLSPTPGVYLGQQDRKAFGLCYRTKVGSDTAGNDAGYKLHLLYGCKASPSERAYGTINDSPEAITFSWEVSTTPVPIGGEYKPVSLITIDSRTANKEKLKTLEDMLYGTSTGAGGPVLPKPDVVISTMKTSD